MNRDSWPRSRVLTISGVILVVVVAVVVIVLVSGGSKGTPKTTTATTTTATQSGSLVLSSADAKRLGFATTVQAAKKTAVKDQKGCTDSVEAVYEDAANKTGLVSDVLICESPAAATTALATARKEVTVDSALQPPPQLGPEAFATASNAPEYLMVWRAGDQGGHHGHRPRCHRLVDLHHGGQPTAADRSAGGHPEAGRVEAELVVLRGPAGAIRPEGEPIGQGTRGA